MKKKIIASLLAACLFVGMAVPAFAEYSSQSGLDEDVKTMEFLAKEYTVKNGGDAVDLSKEVQAYASTKQLVQEPNIIWSIENDDKYAFSISDSGSVTASEDAGTATVIATARDGKVKATTKVVAAKNVIVNATGFQFAATTKVLQYGIETMAYGVDGVNYKDQNIDIVATPKDAIFTKAQLDALNTATDTAVTAGTFDITDGTTTVTPDVSRKDNKISLVYTTGAVASVARASYEMTVTAATANGVVTVAGVDVALDVSVETDDAKQAAKIAKAINSNSAAWMATSAAKVITVTPKQGHFADAAPTGALKTDATAFAVSVVATAEKVEEMAALTGTKIDAKRSELSVEFPNANEKITSKPMIKKSVTISGVPAKAVSAINAAGTVTIEVGEKIKTANMFKQTPSKGNITFPVSYVTDYVDGNAQVSDYAVLTGGGDGEIIGVAVGTNRLIGSIANIDGKSSSASIIVKVIEKGTKTPAATAKMTSTAHPSMPTKGTFQIVVAGATAEQKITYKVYAGDEAYISVSDTGLITALKATGADKIAKAYVLIDGKDAGMWVNVKIADMPVVDPGKPTVPPSTGV